MDDAIASRPAFTLDPVIPESDLSPDLLKKDKWKSTKFKKFNLDAAPVHPAGALHPLLKVRSEFRQIFLEMGFSEMPTNNYVESSFWNFDALFQPQQHPARDAHDTFFMTKPAQTKDLPEEYVVAHRKQERPPFLYGWERAGGLGLGRGGQSEI